MTDLLCHRSFFSCKGKTLNVLINDNNNSNSLSLKFRDLRPQELFGKLVGKMSSSHYIPEHTKMINQQWWSEKIETRPRVAHWSSGRGDVSLRIAIA